MQVTLEFPDDIGFDEREAKERVVSLLYERGTLSEKQGRDILGVSRRQFQRVLADHDVAYMSGDADDIKHELRHRSEQ
jgi:predicted HTH domain antitoxin